MTIPFMYGHILPGQDASKAVVYIRAGAARPRPVERILVREN